MNRIHDSRVNLLFIRYTALEDINSKKWTKIISLLSKQHLNNNIQSSTSNITNNAILNNNLFSKIPANNLLCHHQLFDLASLELIVNQFNLTFKQKIMFQIFTAPTFNQNLAQRRCYLGGEGGTGKSRVIAAIQYFFNINNMNNKLYVTATTGAAAHLINANTIDKIAKISRGKCLTTIKNKSIQIENDEILTNHRQLQSQWLEKDFLICDEISLCGCVKLNKINVNLQSAKLCLDQPFGNVHCLFVGDFFQHGSVKDRPLYKPSFGIENVESNELTNTLRKTTNKLHSTTSQNKNVAGRNLWLNLTHVIILDEQMRQSND